MNHSILRRLSIPDKILIITLIMVIGVSAFALFRDTDDKVVLVFKDNVLIDQYDLGIDRDINIDEHNSVRIRNGKVSMSYADCPDKRCLKQSETSSMPIICLPNRVYIKIQSKKGDESRLILR